MFLGISQETWAGVLIGTVVVPILWWLLRRLRDWLYTTNPRAMVLGAMALDEERTCIFVRDLQVQLHQPMPGMTQEDRWPLLDRATARLGSGIEGRGINIPVVWADVDAQSLPRYYNHSPLSIYLYTPYSCVNSVIAFTFSTFAVIKGTSTSMMKPPPSPMTSISFLQ